MPSHVKNTLLVTYLFDNNDLEAQAFVPKGTEVPCDLGICCTREQNITVSIFSPSHQVLKSWWHRACGRTPPFWGIARPPRSASLQEHTRTLRKDSRNTGRTMTTGNKADTAGAASTWRRLHHRGNPRIQHIHSRNTGRTMTTGNKADTSGAASTWRRLHHRGNFRNNCNKSSHTASPFRRLALLRLSPPS